jgi:hypothetical protein
MSSLHSKLRELQPIDTESKVEEVLYLLKTRKTKIDSYVSDMVCNYIGDIKLIEYYKSKEDEAKNYIASQPSSKKKHKRSKGSTNDEMDSLRMNSIDPNKSDYYSQLLKENLKNKFDGYEYGLSDW